MEKIKHELDLLPMVLGSKSKLRSDGKGPLIIRVTLNCKTQEISLSENVTPINWLSELKEVSKFEENYKLINKKIRAAEVDLNRIYDKLYLEYERVTPLMIKRVYKGEPPIEPTKVECEKAQLSLLQLFDVYIEKFEKHVKEGKRSEATLRQWRSTKSKVGRFLSYKYSEEKKEISEDEIDLTKITDILFPEISPDFGDEMFDYFTAEAPKTIAEATAKKHIKKTKQIIRLAVKKNLIHSNPIADFICGGDTNEVVPLEWEDVETIYKKHFGVQRLDEVSDAFIFQCFTGFAYQDLYNLTSENIILVGSTKERWLCKHRGKTGVYEIVPILPIVEELIEKYKNHPVCIQRGSLLPILSNAHYNGYLKEIGTICGIEREMNTHLARHTFADIMLNLGMPLEDVSKMLGHKSIRTTQRYARVRKIRIQMNFNKYVRPVIYLTGDLKQEQIMNDPEDQLMENIKTRNLCCSVFNSTAKFGTINYNYTEIA